MRPRRIIASGYGGVSVLGIALLVGKASINFDAFLYRHALKWHKENAQLSVGRGLVLHKQMR